MTILLTGAAGFIGFHLSKRLLIDGYDLIGVDDINNYYDPNLKKDRLNQLELTKKNKFRTFYIKFLKIIILNCCSNLELSHNSSRNK